MSYTPQFDFPINNNGREEIIDLHGNSVLGATALSTTLSTGAAAESGGGQH